MQQIPKNSQQAHHKRLTLLAAYLVADEIGGVISVAVLEQEVFVDRSGYHGCLSPPQSLELAVTCCRTPHGQCVRKVDILRGGFLRLKTQKGRYVRRFNWLFFRSLSTPCKGEHSESVRGQSFSFLLPVRRNYVADTELIQGGGRLETKGHISHENYEV